MILIIFMFQFRAHFGPVLSIPKLETIKIDMDSALDAQIDVYGETIPGDHGVGFFVRQCADKSMEFQISIFSLISSEICIHIISKKTNVFRTVTVTLLLKGVLTPQHGLSM